MTTNEIRQRAYELAFARESEKRQRRAYIEAEAQRQGLFLGSINPVYRGMASETYRGFTVPAMNIRGMVYDLAQAAFAAAKECDAGPFMFEIAPAELSEGGQTFDEYAGEVLAAALAQGYTGPVFLQGDHFHIESANADDVSSVVRTCSEALSCGFYQIDIDASELVLPGGASQSEHESWNADVTAQVLKLVRGFGVPGSAAVLGGEVGRIGGELTSVEELRSYLTLLREKIGPQIAGIGKVSVNTGTQHGGRVGENGRIARMPVDFELILRLSSVARKEFGLPGVVQHGASTLGIDQLRRLPESGVNEVHLATAIQTTIFNSPAFPAGLLERMKRELTSSGGAKTGPESTVSQGWGDPTSFHDQAWRAWGRFKRELWELPEEVRESLRNDLKNWFLEVFLALGLNGRRAILAEISSMARPGAGR